MVSKKQNTKTLKEGKTTDIIVDNNNHVSIKTKSKNVWIQIAKTKHAIWALLVLMFLIHLRM